MSIHREVNNGKITFVAIAQSNGTRLKKRFVETKYPSLSEAQKAAESWEADATRQARLQTQIGVKITARGMADLASWEHRSKELGVDLRKVIEMGLQVAAKGANGYSKKTFSEAVSLYSGDLVLANNSEDYVRQVKLRLAAFGADFGDRLLTEISSSDIQTFLELRKFAPKGCKLRPKPLGTTAWNNWLRDFTVFFRWCITRKFLGENPVVGVVKKVKTRAELAMAPSTWSPEYCQEVIDACRKAWNYRTGTPAAAREDVPYIAIGILCGLRPQETARLDWGRHIDWDRNEIWVSSDIAKTRQNRHVPMPENLVRILEPYRKESGPVSDNYRNVYQRLRKAGWSLPQDALRHTFASWNIALYEDAEKTKFRMGHHEKSELLFSKYRALMKKDVAAKYLELK